MILAAHCVAYSKWCDPYHIAKRECRLGLTRSENLGGEVMACEKCDLGNQSAFNGELAIHFPGFKGLDKPIVWVYPKLLVCLDCGFTEFAIPETELRVLRDGIGPSAAAS